MGLETTLEASCAEGKEADGMGSGVSWPATSNGGHPSYAATAHPENDDNISLHVGRYRCQPATAPLDTRRRHFEELHAATDWNRDHRHLLEEMDVRKLMMDASAQALLYALQRTLVDTPYRQWGRTPDSWEGYTMMFRNYAPSKDERKPVVDRFHRFCEEVYCPLLWTLLFGSAGWAAFRPHWAQFKSCTIKVRANPVQIAVLVMTGWYIAQSHAPPLPRGWSAQRWQLCTPSCHPAWRPYRCTGYLSPAESRNAILRVGSAHTGALRVLPDCRQKAFLTHVLVSIPVVSVQVCESGMAYGDNIFHMHIDGKIGLLEPRNHTQRHMTRLLFSIVTDVGAGRVPLVAAAADPRAYGVTNYPVWQPRRGFASNHAFHVYMQAYYLERGLENTGLPRPHYEIPESLLYRACSGEVLMHRTHSDTAYGCQPIHSEPNPCPDRHLYVFDWNNIPGSGPGKPSVEVPEVEIAAAMSPLGDASSPAYAARLEDTAALARDLLPTAGSYPGGREALEAVMDIITSALQEARATDSMAGLPRAETALGQETLPCS